MWKALKLSIAAIALMALTANTRAEVKEVVLGQQFGSVFLPAMAMENTACRAADFADSTVIPSTMHGA